MCCFTPTLQQTRCFLLSIPKILLVALCESVRRTVTTSTDSVPRRLFTIPPFPCARMDVIIQVITNSGAHYKRRQLRQENRGMDGHSHRPSSPHYRRFNAFIHTPPFSQDLDPSTSPLRTSMTSVHSLVSPPCPSYQLLVLTQLALLHTPFILSPQLL